MDVTPKRMLMPTPPGARTTLRRLKPSQYPARREAVASIPLRDVSEPSVTLRYDKFTVRYTALCYTACIAEFSSMGSSAACAARS